MAGASSDNTPSSSSDNTPSSSSSDATNMATATFNNTAPLRIDEVRVRSGRLVCLVSVDPNERWTTPELAEVLLAAHSTLAMHSCVNDKGKLFGDVIAHTSIPHLLEHLTIDLMAHADGSPDDVFTGWTQWEDEQRGLAQVQIAFTDDLVALRALRDAAREIAETMTRTHHD